MGKIFFYSTLILSMLSLSGCTDDGNGLNAEGEGMLALRTSFDSTVRTESRAVSDDEEAHLNETLQLWIYKQTGDPATSGVIRQYKGIDQVPQTLTLNSGTYSVEAWAGDSVSASWDKRWYHGIVDNVTIKKGKSTQVDVMCKIANVAVEVKYAPEVTEALEIDSLVVSHSRAWLTFKGTDPEHTLGYFMMPNGETTLSWTISGHRKTGDQVETTLYTVTRNITNVVKGRKYVFDIKLADGESDVIGGGFLDIAVNEEPLATVESQAEVKLAPAIAYQGTDNLDPVRSAPGQVGEKVITINAYGELTSVILECDQLSSILISGSDVDLLGMTDGVKTKLENYIVASYAVNAVKDSVYSSSMYISLRDDFTKLFNTDGTYTVKITAEDSNEKTTEKTATFIISSDPISVEPASNTFGEITPYKAVVKGTIDNMDLLPEGDKNITVHYSAGSARATEGSVKATVEGNTFTAILTGLTPTTTYTYYATVQKKDGSTFSTEPQTITTEGAPQLPNASFENTIKVKDNENNDVTVFADSEQNWFWDSGNWGSITFLSTEVTEWSTENVHNGTYSVALKSQFVGIAGTTLGKFAAGNVFAGKYLMTDGTDGVLGWGRPFTGRPTQLKVWVKYRPVPVNYSGKNKKISGEEHGITFGEPDQGIIYIALLDNTTDSEYPDYPVVVKTKTAQLFNKDGANVIAYGEKIIDETSGEDMIEITIPLDYKRTDIRPTYILLTCAASKGGDYFIGGDGSKMWLDDMELVYE